MIKHIPSFMTLKPNEDPSQEIITLTPAVVRQEVNFLESNETSLQRTTVNLKWVMGQVMS